MSAEHELKELGAFVYWEEDPSRKRALTGRCGNCERTHVYVFDPKHMGTVVSPTGVMHVGAEYGMTACGIDATGEDWWWRL